MKKAIILTASIFSLLAISFFGCDNEQPAEASCPTKYIALAETASVTGNPAGGVTLFEIDDLDTECYDKLRIFTHVMNDSYQTDPFNSDDRMVIRAFHGIGNGSWGYYSEEFPMEFTSEFHGFIEIPVVGDTTRLVVSGYNMPAVNLKVDVAAYLVK